MLFDSPEYLLSFLPVVCAYRARTGTTEAQINWLLLASIVFCGSRDPLLVLLIVFPIAVNFLVDRVLQARKATAGFTDTGYLPVYNLMTICAFICWFMSNTQRYLRDFDPVISADNAAVTGLFSRWQPNAFHAAIMVLMLSLGLFSLTGVKEFIYFQC